MVLRKSGRVGSRRFRRESPQASMLEGSLFFFVRRGVSEGVCLRTERGEGSEGGFGRRAGASLFRFVPSVAPPSAPLEQGVIPSLG